MDRASTTAKREGQPMPAVATTSFLPSCVRPSPPVGEDVGAGIPQKPSSVAHVTMDPSATRTRSIAVSCPPETATYRVVPSGASTPSPPSETYEGPAPSAAEAEAREARTARAAIRRCTAIPPVRGHSYYVRGGGKGPSDGFGCERNVTRLVQCLAPRKRPYAGRTRRFIGEDAATRRSAAVDELSHPWFGACHRAKRRAVENASPCCSDLQQERVALAAAGADRSEAEAAAVSPQLVHHRADDPSARRANRMTERDGAAVHVHDLLVRAEQPRRVERDGRERLVDLDALDVADRFARLLERQVPCARRRAREVGEVVRHIRLREDRREDLEAATLREVLRRDDHARRAVVDPRRVPRRRRPFRVEDRLELRELRERRVLPDALVRGDVAHRDDLLVETSAALRCGGALLGTERPRVLLLAGDAELAGDLRVLLDHVQLVERRREPVEDHRVDQLAVAEPVAEASLLQQVRSVRHRLHAAGDDALVLARADHGVGDLDRADRRSAHLVDRVRRRLDRQPCADGRLARRSLAGARLEHLAHDHVLRLARLEADTSERRLDGQRAELRRL